MESILLSVVPVFALILCGYLGGLTGVLESGAASALNGFVYYFSLPALLFVFTARAPMAELLDGPFLSAFLLGSVTAFAIALIVARLALKVDSNALPIIGLTATFPNTAYLGIPLFVALGDQTGVGAAIAVTVGANTLFIGGTLAYYAISDSAGKKGRGSAIVVVQALLKNPLIMAPILALPFAFFEVGLPAISVQFLDLLGSTAGPAALFALGLSFIGRPFEATPTEVLALTGIKLVLHPAIVAIFALFVFPVSADMVKYAIVLAAFPTGALAFVIALQRNSFVSQSSTVMIVTTVLSVITLSALLIVLP